MKKKKLTRGKRHCPHCQAIIAVGFRTCPKCNTTIPLKRGNPMKSPTEKAKPNREELNARVLNYLAQNPTATMAEVRDNVRHANNVSYNHQLINSLPAWKEHVAKLNEAARQKEVAKRWPPVEASGNHIIQLATMLLRECKGDADKAQEVIRQVNPVYQIVSKS